MGKRLSPERRRLLLVRTVAVAVVGFFAFGALASLL